MKVYLVTVGDYEDVRPYGVYSMLENAKQLSPVTPADDKERERPYMERRNGRKYEWVEDEPGVWYYDTWGDAVWIYEFELDAQP